MMVRYGLYLGGTVTPAISRIENLPVLSRQNGSVQAVPRGRKSLMRMLGNLRLIHKTVCDSCLYRLMLISTYDYLDMYLRHPSGAILLFQGLEVGVLNRYVFQPLG